MVEQALQAEVVHARNGGPAVWPCHHRLRRRAAGRSPRDSLTSLQGAGAHERVPGGQSGLGAAAAGEGVDAEQLEFETVHSGLLTVNRTSDGLYHLGAPLAAPTDAVPECARAGSPMLMVNLEMQSAAPKPVWRFSWHAVPMHLG